MPQGYTAIKRLFWAAAMVPALAIGGSHGATAQDRHVDGNPSWASMPVSNAALDERIREAAQQYLAYAPVTRIAFFDMAFPRDSSEDVALNGYAVIVVTALVQDSNEIPLSSVYFHSASGDQPISRYSAIESTVTDTAMLKTFGRFRLDAVYLAPVSTLTKVGDLLADFARNRKGFRMGQFDGQLPPQVQGLPKIDATAVPPSGAAVIAILRREYPDLTQSLVSTH